MKKTYVNVPGFCLHHSEEILIQNYNLNIPKHLLVYASRIPLNTNKYDWTFGTFSENSGDSDIYKFLVMKNWSDCGEAYVLAYMGNIGFEKINIKNNFKRIAYEWDLEVINKYKGRKFKKHYSVEIN